MNRHISLIAVALLGCTDAPPADTQTLMERGDRDFEPPVVTNAESPVRYPPALFERRAEGTVVLRLFVDADGRVRPESTRVAEGSGHSGLDSAALDAVSRMRFAPARRRGEPVAAAFLQPIHFQHPERSPPGGDR